MRCWGGDVAPNHAIPPNHRLLDGAVEATHSRVALAHRAQHPEAFEGQAPDPVSTQDTHPVASSFFLPSGAYSLAWEPNTAFREVPNARLPMM